MILHLINEVQHPLTSHPPTTATTAATISSFFMLVGGDWLKMSATMVCWQNKKNTGWNTLKQSPKKWNLDQNINDSKSHIWNSFFENIISSIQICDILPQFPVNIIRDIFNFRLSNRKFQSWQKLAKKITHFTIQFCSKNFTHFTNLNSLDIRNNMFQIPS